MNAKRNTCCLAALLAGLSALAGTNEWKLAWSDEFDKPGLVDPAKWNYEKGFVRNREEQYYTVARPENARVESGVLVIEARREDYAAPDGKRARYTAASLNTDGKYAFTRGRVEVRAKLPRARGTWPAIWTLGTAIHTVGWPACGELDILEAVGHDPGALYATVHWLDAATGRHASKGSNLGKQDPYGGFHLYAMEWRPDRIDFFYDGKPYFAYPVAAAGADPAKNPFNQPHYLLLNLAIGGSWGGQKGIDDAAFPQRYEIDYVRIYQPAAPAR